MKKELITFLLFSILTFWASSQIDSVRNVLNEKLVNHTSESIWSIDTSDQQMTTVYVIDTFDVCSGFNPIRLHPRHDTLYVSFKYEKGWSLAKIDSLEKLNLNILNPIVPKYIAYYDSIGWGKARVKKQQLLEQPKSSILQDFSKSKYISEEERTSLFRLARIPDTLIGNIGVFHSRNFPPMYIISPGSLKDEVDMLLDKLHHNVLPISTILRNEGFFLTTSFKEGI
ncbi:MAG: hypothetical protein MK105_18680 [Crocinitomicaceae bacterium]|nr:hypothetical protein [Crocinitomicaceae bacterium]